MNKRTMCFMIAIICSQTYFAVELQSTIFSNIMAGAWLILAIIFFLKKEDDEE